jgi:hypothetical protein
MSETAKHETLDADPSSGVVKLLEKLDLTTLSFTQLRRLQNVLHKASGEVASESAQRAENDASGDTVRVPSPNM